MSPRLICTVSTASAASASALAAEDQRDRADRAGVPAGTVTDAIGGADELRLAADQAEHGVFRLLGTGAHTGTAAHALRGVDRRVERSRFGEAGGERLFLDGTMPGLAALATQEVPGPDLSLIHISEPTRLLSTASAVFCLKKKTK